MNLQTTGFDYAQLDAETRIEVQQRTRNIKSIGKRVACEIFEMGEEFAAVRKLLSHNKTGGFEAWYEAEGFAKNTVYRCIDVYETFANLPKLGRLDIPLSALYELSAHSTPESARVQIVKRAEAGEKITLKETKQVISEAKPKPLPPLTYSKPIDDYQPDVPEVEIEDSHMPIINAPPASPFKLLYRASSPDLMGNLHPVTVTPDKKSNVMAGAYASTKAVEPPVDSRKLMARITELEQRNASQEHNMKALLEDNARLKAQIELNTPKMLIHIVNAASVSQDDANVVMKVHGEATTRAALGLLIQYKVKPHDFAVFSDQLVKLVKDAGKDPAEEQRKADEKAAKKAAKAISYPKNMDKWDEVDFTSYYNANQTTLDALRTAWGHDIKLIHWNDMPKPDRVRFIKVQKALDGYVNCDEFARLIAWKRMDWNGVPLTEIPKYVTDWRQSLNVPNADDDFKALWGGEEEFIPTAENTDPVQAAEVREVMNGLLSILDNNMAELETAHAG